MRSPLRNSLGSTLRSTLAGAIGRALPRGLRAAWRSDPPPRRVEPADVSRFGAIDPDRRDEFRRVGTRDRHFFPHRVHHVLRRGPDGYRLAQSMHGVSDPNCLSQLLLFASEEARRGIPEELFFDDDLVWHRQQLGLPGHVAGVNLASRGRDLLTTARYADIAQRIQRRREHATRVAAAFRGWDVMLLNALLDHAVRHGFECIVLPTAELAMANTDPTREVQRDLFERIYDTNVERCFSARRSDGHWRVDVAENRRRLVPLAPREQPLPTSTTICIAHDTERELGHRGLDPDFEAHAAAGSRAHLERMLEIEARAGVHTTYDVVGTMFEEVRADIESGGHELAFHSFDHDPTSGEQLWRCRDLDYRVRGYRPPNSIVTPELSDENLSLRNFEWLASSPRSLGTGEVAVGASLVRVPIYFDDFALHTGESAHEDWQAELLASVTQRRITTFGLHDCYADHWIAEYPALLAKLADLGTICTIGEVADRAFLGATED